MTDDKDWLSHDELSETIRLLDGDILIASGLSYYPFENALYRELFRIRSEIGAEASHRLGGNGEGFVGIHIRRTDNRMLIERSPIELFIRAMKEEIASHADVSFYLASDDEETKYDVIHTIGSYFGMIILAQFGTSSV